jgi:hypothetical protein
VIGVSEIADYDAGMLGRVIAVDAGDQYSAYSFE